VVVPESAKPDQTLTDRDAWKQIFEGTDTRRRLLQYGVLLAVLLPLFLFVAAASVGWLEQPARQFGPVVVVLVFVVFNAAWIVGASCLLAWLKHRWQVAYKGRTLRMELVATGHEKLSLDGKLLARSTWGLSFQELQASIPDGPGAGDKVRVLGHFGFLTPTCMIFVSEGSPPTLALVPSRWTKARQRARPFIWVAALVASLVVSVVLFAWLNLYWGSVSVSVDDPELVVMLDGELFMSGEKSKPGSPDSSEIRSLRTGTHTLRALKRGKVVFDETFRLTLKELRHFDLMQAALEKRDGSSLASDADRLQGAWIAVSASVKGRRLSEPAVNALGAAVTFLSGNRVNWKANVMPDSSDIGTALNTFGTDGIVQLDPTKSPKTIDMRVLRMGVGGKPERHEMLGIYRLDGDTLEICVAVDPDLRDEAPTRFDSAAGKFTVNLVLKRMSDQ
jgi:uncharacterized protein (TIGR03067 family)